ncbi:DNA translocase FtsK [candidate division WWE3 bacterium]|jgi:S-DNA-T family DNA segregation ATPase FtsK/SpoIIIE|uniref:DNA translocase FtsK n=1 Tax=candidate division WWE3 bacterium TaxID=2053526 RepID=A0A3A4ZE49_UNCKA|nr:MAG: DNA translocase FtsK [candidate division WWE3 bacterium]
MPRGRKKKFKLSLNIKPETSKTIAALLLILFGVLTLVSFIAPDYSLNEKIQVLWKSLFGVTAIFVPFLLILLALLFVESVKMKIKEPKILIGIFLLFITLTGFFHVFVSEEEAYELARDGGGGGLFGYKIAGLLVNTISIYGAVLVLLMLGVISLVIIFDVSLDQIVAFLAKIFGNIHFGEVLSKFKREKHEGEESEIEISSGVPAMSENEQEQLSKQQVGDAKGAFGDDFAFEIVPSLSEPQSEHPEIPVGSVHSLVHATPTLPYIDRVWKNPPLEILMDSDEKAADSGDTDLRGKKIKDTLKAFGIEVDIADTKVGPSVTQYALKLKEESGIKVSKIASLQNDIALALASPNGTVRIEAPIPGKSLIGIEVPNNTRAIVSFKSLITSEPMKGLKSKLGIALGKDVGGRVHVYDIGKMPHMLVAGTTGSGKSIFIHNILFSVLYRATPQEVKLILIDPKRVELSRYNDIPHLLSPVVTDTHNAGGILKWAVSEMERRYKLFESAKVSNIEGYNIKSGFQALHYIMIVVEEFPEVMAVDQAGVEKTVIRLAQLARATGIHLVLALQRPSTDIITGLIKANIPCRVAFNVMSQVDSRVIIDQPGAEKLLGRGDMLFIPPDISKPVRLQAALVSDKEIADLVTFLKSQGVAPEYNHEILQSAEQVKSGSAGYGGESDELFDQAVDIVVSAQKASASLLQRKLSIGYARAARIMDMLEEKGIIGPSDGAKPRGVLIDGMYHTPESSGFEHKEDDTISEIL